MNTLVEPGLQKAVGKAIVLVGKGQVCKGSGELIGLECQGPAARQSTAAYQHPQNAHQDPLFQRKGIPGALPEKQDQAQGREDQCHGQQNDVSGGEVIGEGIQTGVEYREIRHGEGRHPVEQDEAVDPTGHQPDDGCQDAPEHPPAQKQRGHQGNQHNQRIHQQGQGIVRYKFKKRGKALRKGFMIEELHHNRDAKRQKGIDPQLLKRLAFGRMRSICGGFIFGWSYGDIHSMDPSFLVQ